MLNSLVRRLRTKSVDTSAPTSLFDFGANEDRIAVIQGRIAALNALAHKSDILSLSRIQTQKNCLLNLIRLISETDCQIRSELVGNRSPACIAIVELKDVQFQPGERTIGYKLQYYIPEVSVTKVATAEMILVGEAHMKLQSIFVREMCRSSGIGSQLFSAMNDLNKMLARRWAPIVFEPTLNLDHESLQAFFEKFFKSVRFDGDKFIIEKPI